LALHRGVSGIKPIGNDTGTWKEKRDNGNVFHVENRVSHEHANAPISAPLLGVAQEGAPNSSPDEDG
jgi:hypothetical protein